MLPSQNRCRYGKNQLTDVICQFRFPEIPGINEEDPLLFKTAIGDLLPIYVLRQDIPAPKITGTPGNFALENQPKTHNHQFSSVDGNTKVNMTGNFISLSCANYRCWEDFAAILDRVVVTFLQIYRPERFLRIGLRYLNVFSRRELGLEGVPFRELIDPKYLGPLADMDVQEAGVARCTLDVDMALTGGARLKLHAGPGKIKRGGMDDPEVRFVFDQDLYVTGNLPPQLISEALILLHNHADSLFRGAITERLHTAMKPETH